MRTTIRASALLAVLHLFFFALAQTDILQGVVAEADAPTPQVTTEELERIIADGSALLLDSRSFSEWAVGHLPGAVVLAPKPDQPASQYVSDVAEVERLTGGDRAAAIVLYCNGPHCGKSRRLSGELAEAGYTAVRRYQLGAPVWRALGHPVVIEPAGVQYVLEGDATAYWVDARDPAEVAVMGSLAGVRNLANVPSGTVTLAKDEKRLPMHDYNTRIVVFGADGAQARQVAAELTAGAFHNVAYFDGTFETLLEAAASPEGAAVVRRFYDALAAGDVPAILDLLSPDVAWIEPEGVPFAGTHLGPDALLEHVLARIGAEWDEFGVVPDEFIGAGERVTVLGTLSGVNKATGKALRTPYVAVWTVQGGKVTRYQSFVNTIAFAEATR